MTTAQAQRDPERIADWVRDARRRTFELTQDLSDDQLRVPLLQTVNPFQWEIGHVAWFQENFVLHPLTGGPPLLEGAAALYDSSAVHHDTRWDLALSGTLLRTNGGASGAGVGGAVETELTSLAELVVLPADGWEADVRETPAAGGPAVSHSAVLSGWYEGAPERPRAVVYGVRTVDGELAALRVLSYAGGVYRLEIAFAGAGQTTFIAAGI